MSRPLYILRAHWTETYDCPDNGETDICDTYEDLYISYDRAPLDTIAENLCRGFDGKHWNEGRANELRGLYEDYNRQEKITYTVHDVSNLILTKATS